MVQPVKTAIIKSIQYMSKDQNKSMHCNKKDDKKLSVNPKGLVLQYFEFKIVLIVHGIIQRN